MFIRKTLQQGLGPHFCSHDTFCAYYFTFVNIESTKSIAIKSIDMWEWWLLVGVVIASECTNEFEPMNIRELFLHQ